MNIRYYFPFLFSRPSEYRKQNKELIYSRSRRILRFPGCFANALPTSLVLVNFIGNSQGTHSTEAPKAPRQNPIMPHGQAWIPRVYISAVLPTMIMAEKLDASNDIIVGITLSFRSAMMNSSVVRCFPPVIAWYKPIASEMSRKPTKMNQSIQVRSAMSNTPLLITEHLL